ncbi:MAG: hypothetical protein AAFV53_37325, partial [Myxococcota bacterium]
NPGMCGRDGRSSMYTARRPLMVKISIEGNNLILAVQGMHKVWALKAKIEVPLSSVVSLRCTLSYDRPGRTFPDFFGL